VHNKDRLELTPHYMFAMSAVLMAMCSVFWERGAYSALEHLFRQSAEFCSEHEAWKLNVAHTFFMQV
jgi:hypothetical protein